jgi:hypothetical protein
MNLFTLHAFILYFQLNFLILVLSIAPKMLCDPDCNRLRVFILVITSLAVITWILCFLLLLLPDQADWLVVAFAEYIYLAYAFLFLCAALWATRSGSPSSKLF